MNTMTEEIKDAIRNNLSAEVGEVLKEQLARIPELERGLREKERDLNTSIKIVADLREEHKVLNAKIEELIAREMKHDELKVREDVLAIKEATLAAQITDAINHEKVLQVRDIKELVALAFKSPVYRKSTSVFKNDPSIGAVINSNEDVEMREE